MGLHDLMKKKAKLGEGDAAYSETLNKLTTGPEFTLIRSDTDTHEIIYSSGPAAAATTNSGANSGSGGHHGFLSAGESVAQSMTRRSLDVFRPRSRNNSFLSVSGDSDSDASNGGKHRRLSHRLGLGRRAPKTSEYVPENLPQINVINTPDGPATEETQWAKRATMLATTNEERQRRKPSPTPSLGVPDGDDGGDAGSLPKNTSGVVSSKEIDQDIQEAIRLHEEGDLERSTQLFGRLADPYGANNPLSQVLYGLALRHGWGCEPDLPRAVTYLSAAASNAAAVENMALKAGLKKGGAAKGELVLAIFELANCFRHGWGIAKDPVAAKQYYETAANLGDTDAMNETAWCYLEGFGCKKDKFQAARYYRLAEKNGSKTLGNTCLFQVLAVDTTRHYLLGGHYYLSN